MIWPWTRRPDPAVLTLADNLSLTPIAELVARMLAANAAPDRIVAAVQLVELTPPEKPQSPQRHNPDPVSTDVNTSVNTDVNKKRKRAKVGRRAYMAAYMAERRRAQRAA